MDFYSGPDIPAVVTLAPIGKEKVPTTFDGYPLKVALQRLLDEGAACVGVNCARGPNPMIQLKRHLKQEVKVGWCASTLQISLLHNCCANIHCGNFSTTVFLII